jgi:DNA helicase-2/ATP-dependent DNA helicase PcrA
MRKVDARFDNDYTYFDRSGKIPRYIVTEDIAGSIARHLPELSGFNAVGIITGTVEEAVTLHRSFSRNSDVQLITAPSAEITARIVLLPLILAKGLEFDAVFLVNCFPDSGDEASDRRRAYLACTRALHELIIVANAPLPASYADCAPYIQEESV